ncbi:hypothetical protein LQZ18_07050 [Lachnospiraceae bacterium ZAX-1]
MAVGYISYGNLQHTAGAWVYFLFMIYPLAIALSTMFIKNGNKIETYLRMLICVGFLQAMIAICSYCIPPIWEIFLKLLENVMSLSVIEFWSERNRLYGWSNTLMFSMAIVQGTLGILALAYALKKDKKYIIVVPLIWIAGILNARTTFVVILIGMAISVYSLELLSKKNMKKVLAVIAIFAIFGIVVMNLSYINNGWVLDGIKEIGNFFLGRKTGYFQYLDHENNIVAFALPKGLSFLTGTGNMGTQSDIGYIHDIWAGGLCYTVLLYLFYLYLIYDMKLSLCKLLKNKRIGNGIAIFAGSILFVTNVKGHIFGLNEFMNLFVCTYIICCCTKEKVKKNFVIGGWT